MEDGGPAHLEIGATLKQTRQRLGLDISEVERRTKIRIKYLRALENEEWDVLPAPAYVRGFLRAYADLLELDGEVLADEYRRRYEATDPSSAPAPVSGVFSERRRQHSRDRVLSGRALGVLGGIGLVVLIVIVVALLTGGSGDGSGARSEPRDGATSTGDAGSGPGERVRLALVADSEIEVCVTDAAGEPLVDAQLLTEGRREKLGTGTFFGVDLGAGEARLIVNGAAQSFDLAEPASFEVTASGIATLPFSGPGCP